MLSSTSGRPPRPQAPTMRAMAAAAAVSRRPSDSGEPCCDHRRKPRGLVSHLRLHVRDNVVRVAVDEPCQRSFVPDGTAAEAAFATPAARQRGRAAYDLPRGPQAEVVSN